MANISTYASDKALDALFRNSAYTSTSTWVSLWTAAPTMPAGTGGTEVTGGSYVRERLDTLLAAAAAEASSNSSDITWPQATADWGTVVGVGIHDASTAGNLLAFGTLTANKTVSNGDTFSIPSTNLGLGLS
jgi:hypothetical protein